MIWIYLLKIKFQALLYRSIYKFVVSLEVVHNICALQLLFIFSPTVLFIEQFVLYTFQQIVFTKKNYHFLDVAYVKV